jgi:hypothetical protein
VNTHLLSSRDDLSPHPSALSQTVLMAVTLAILLAVTGFVIRNGASVETHPAHFPARVPH